MQAGPHLSSISNEEFSATLSRGGKANERAVYSSLFESALVVKTDVVLGEGLLVNLLVHSIPEQSDHVNF